MNDNRHDEGCNGYHADADEQLSARTGADLSKIKSKTRKDKNVKAPLKKGEKVGETVYYLDRKKIGARDIVTTEKVEKQNYGSALENVLEEYFGI